MLVRFQQWRRISIHALREESDAVDESDYDEQGISIHALREESDRQDHTQA